jgi:hypothetical protein
MLFDSRNEGSKLVSMACGATSGGPWPAVNQTLDIVHAQLELKNWAGRCGFTPL